jgi:hypothetical protein
MVQAASRKSDHGGPSFVPGFFVVCSPMGGVHVGVSPFTSDFPSLSFNQFYVIIHSCTTDAI